MLPSSVKGGGLPDSLNDLPGMLPPPGVVPNFDDPYSRGETYVAVATTIVVIMIVFVTCKLYTKRFIIRKLQWDDLTCLLGALAALSYYINCLYEVKQGKIGIHQWNVRLSYLSSNAFLVPSYLAVILVPPAMIFTKLTFFLFYLQIFWPFKWLRICIYLGATVTAVFYSVVEIFWLYYMTPRKGQTFASVAASPAEYKTPVLSVPVAAVGLGIDMYLLVLPISAVMQLQLPTRRKIGIVSIFVTGIAACVSSALSVYYRALLNSDNIDITWNLLSVNILSLSEMSVGLCCVSMPALCKMLGHVVPSHQKIKTWLNTRYGSAKSEASKSPLWKSIKMSRIALFSKDDTRDRSRESYIDIERNGPERSIPQDMSLPFRQGPTNESVHTFINSGTGHMIDGNGIHFEVEMQQHSQYHDSA